MAYKIPSTCPSCGTLLIRDGAHFFCPADSICPAQVQQRLQHAVSKGALDWNGFGPAQVNLLIDKCGCRQFSDILAFDPDAITAVLGPGQKAKFLAERERVKTAPLWRKVVALGIEGVGQTAAKALCEDYHSLDEIAGIGPEKLTELLGPVAAKSFIQYLTKHLAELDRCEEYGYMFSEAAPTASSEVTGPLVGKTIVLTGAMTTGTRSHVSAIIEKQGGKVKGGVTKGVDYLVAGEAGGASKANAAKKLGTQVITEEELYALMQLPMNVPTGTPANEWD